MNRAYEGICNILENLKRKEDVVPVAALHVLKRDCDLQIGQGALDLPTDLQRQEKIPSFEDLWKSLSKDVPQSGNINDITVQKSVQMGAAFMYDILVNKKYI